MILALVGVIWLAYGWALFTGPARPMRFGRFPMFLDAVLTDRWAAALWAVCGVVGLAAAFFPKRVSDAVGFNALLAPPLIWTVLSGWSWLSWVISRGEFGGARAWVSAIIWSAAVVVISVTAGWPDPPNPARGR